MDKNEEIEMWALMMEELNTGNDYEAIHYRADNLLCELLISLGYGEVITVYKKIIRWHA